MTREREDKGGWDRTEWASEPPPEPDEKRSPTWNKSEYIGDHGGPDTTLSPDDTAEGDVAISGRRHVSGESHWARPAPDPEPTRHAEPDDPAEHGTG